MKTGARGFTLIELLAAIAIFAVMAVMAYGGLSAVLRARSAVEASLARTAEIQKAIYRLQSDFEQARSRHIRDEYGDIQAAFRTEDEGREGLRVEFTRGGWRNPRLLRRAAFERVSYGLKEGSLVRYSWQTLDRAQEGTPMEIPVLGAVESLEWQFLDSQRNWSSEWPPRSVTGDAFKLLPIAVELRVTTKDLGEVRYLFRLVGTQAAGPAPGILP